MGDARWIRTSVLINILVSPDSLIIYAKCCCFLIRDHCVGKTNHAWLMIILRAFAFFHTLYSCDSTSVPRNVREASAREQEISKLSKVYNRGEILVDPSRVVH